jgi:hypothetical protein
MLVFGKDFYPFEGHYRLDVDASRAIILMAHQRSWAASLDGRFATGDTPTEAVKELLVAHHSSSGIILEGIARLQQRKAVLDGHTAFLEELCSST